MKSGASYHLKFPILFLSFKLRFNKSCCFLKMVETEKEEIRQFFFYRYIYRGLVRISRSWVPLIMKSKKILGSSVGALVLDLKICGCLAPIAQMLKRTLHISTQNAHLSLFKRKRNKVKILLLSSFKLPNVLT